MNPKRVPCPEEPGPSTSSDSPKKSLEEVSNVIDKAITNVAEKFGMGRHPVKGIINRLLRNKEFSKLTAGQTDDLEAELPTIKLTRSKAKFLRKEGIGVGEADLVMRETPKEEEKQEVTKDGLDGESSSSSSGDDSDDEEFIPSEEEGAKKAESDDETEQEEKEDAPSEEEEEFIVIDEGQVTAQDVSPSKAANLNDAAIFDDLAQSNYDLFNLDRLSPSGIRELDPEYLDFISGPLRNEDEDDDPDYAPKKWQTKKVLKELDELDESFSMTSPRWEENDNNYNLFKNFVSSVNPQSQNLNLDVFDDEEEDQDYEPQEEAEEESDSEDELDESVAIRAPVADALELKTKSLLTTTFNEEEEGDLDYMYMSDDEDEDEEDERRTRRKGITISQREVKWLQVDSADFVDDPILLPAVSLYQQDRQLDREYRQAAKEYRKHHKRVTRPMLKRKTCFLAPDDNSDTLLLEEGQTPEFRQCEADQLVQQLEQHVQFAVQGLIQCFHVARLQNERNQYQEMINELETLYQENGENSLFNIVNLPAAIETCHDVWRVELTTNDRAFIEWANAPSNVKGHMPRPESCLVMTRSQALLYPELVPYMQAPEIPAAVSNRYTDYEETLLLLGLIQFAHVPNSSRHTKGRYHLIKKHLLPTREVSQIRERLSNIRKLPVRNQLHNLILEAEDRNPSIAFTPSFPIRVPDFTTMIDWPPELRPVWFEKFVEWFSVTDHIYVAFTGTDDKERIKKEFLIKKPAKQKKKEIVKNKATYGISNYVNVCKYLNSLFHPEDGEERPESREQEEERSGEREENNENVLYGAKNAVEDMPDVGMVVPKEDKDKDAGIPATMLMQSTPERTKESGNQETIRGGSTATSTVNGRAPSTPSKRVTFKPLSPRNDGGEQQKSAEDTPSSLPSVDVVMNSNELPAEISNLPSRSKRKQSVPMKKSEADRAERWRNRLAKKTSMSPGTMHRLRTELDMSESEGEGEEEERAGKEEDVAQQGTSRLNPEYNADDDVQNIQSLVLPVERRLVDGEQGRSSRSCSFVPITPHLRTSSEASSSSSPRSDTRFTTPFRTPSPTYGSGSQLPAPRTPRDDGMTMSPTLICASSLNLSPHFTLGNDSICVPARRRLVGPTDFSSIDEPMAERPGPSSASQQQLLRPPIRARRDILVNTVSDSAQKRWRKRGREEIMRDGQVAMMDGEYRAKQEALLARHIFVDVKRRLSMHRDVMNQIAAIMRSGRKPAQMLLALESLLFESHRDVLCLLSFTFSSSDASPRLLADPTRKTYRNALDMILAIDAYCSRAKYKISTKNLFKTVTTQCCTGATTPREFTTAMRDLFGNDKPLWEFLKLHMPMYFEETVVPTEMEFIDLTKTDEVGKEEHVDASRVFGAVPANKKRNKVHIQHERLYVYNGTTYVTAQVQKNKDSESAEAPSSSPLKLPMKRKIAPSKTKKPDPPPPQPEEEELKEAKEEPPPVEPKWTRELDLTILNTYNETEEEDDEAVVDELVRKIPFGREHIGARLKFLLAQFNSL